jgi:hypothetical protein
MFCTRHYSTEDGGTMLKKSVTIYHMTWQQHSRKFESNTLFTENYFNTLNLQELNTKFHQQHQHTTNLYKKKNEKLVDEIQ